MVSTCVLVSRSFFKSLTRKNSLRALSQKSRINYSSLKQWARGDYLLPEESFRILLEYAENPRSWEEKAQYIAANWGQIKGGQAAVHGKTTEELGAVLEKARNARRWLPREIKYTIDEKFCEFYGALMGDGCLSVYKCKDGYNRYEISISGDIDFDADYHLTRLKPLITEIFDVKVRAHTNKDGNERFLSIKNKYLVNHLNTEFNFSLGKKLPNLAIPAQIIALPWELKKCVIRGLFDTDGSIYAKKREGYRYPQIAITSGSKVLIQQLYEILPAQGYPCYISSHNEDVIVRGIKNVNRWMEDIGSSNDKHRYKYKYWKSHGTLPPYLLSRRAGGVMASHSIGENSKIGETTGSTPVQSTL